MVRRGPVTTNPSVAFRRLVTAWEGGQDQSQSPVVCAYVSVVACASPGGCSSQHVDKSNCQWRTTCSWDPLRVCVCAKNPGLLFLSSEQHTLFTHMQFFIALMSLGEFVLLSINPAIHLFSMNCHLIPRLQRVVEIGNRLDPQFTNYKCPDWGFLCSNLWNYQIVSTMRSTCIFV